MSRFIYDRCPLCGLKTMTLTTRQEQPMCFCCADSHDEANPESSRFADSIILEGHEEAV